MTKKIYYKVKESALIKWRRWFSEKIFTFFTNFALTGCKSGEKEFDEESLQNLKETAQSYSETELQNGDVRLNEYISLKGEIVESDSRSSLIKKGDRFILKSGSSKYQVFNEQKKKLKIGDEVTVYGEYYGFLKGTLIESEENHDSATN